MKAVVLKDIGAPLTVQEVDVPSLEEGEVLVRIKAAALNRRDLWIQKGQYAGLKFPIILGSDGSGVIEKLSSTVEQSWVGQNVIINPSLNWGDSQAFQSSEFSILGMPHNGTFAEFVKVNVENIYAMPEGLSYEEAASLPLAGLTAFRALFSRAALKAKEKVLIVGVGGGVASIGLLMALKVQAEVYVTSGDQAKIEKSKLLGATGGENYHNDHWAANLKKETGGFDVILDSALGPGFGHHLDLAKPGGRIVFCGSTAGDLPTMNARKIFWKQLSILGTTMGSPSDFRNMLYFVNEQKIKPLIDTVFSIDEADRAIELMNSSSRFGKIVLKMAI